MAHAGTPRADAQKKSVRAAEQDRPDLAAARQAWREDQPRLGRKRLIFLDETGCTTTMARRYGRSPRGTRAMAAVPHAHRKTSTFIAALSEDGITAPFVFDHAMDGDIFRQYVAQMLAPTLQPGDTVIMDNLSTHKVSGIRTMIEARGASLLYLPAYSPDLNPIELVFAKLKHLLRSAAPRTIDSLWTTIGTCLKAFSPDECKRYIRHTGYGHTV